ncbi:MAG: DUF503 domain-containing protein [Planctomycetota bacterium]
MVVAILQAELAIPGAASLKDKRRVVKSLKDRLHREHQVSVAEVAAQDIHNVAVLGVAMVSGSGEVAGATLDRVENKLRGLLDAEVVATMREILQGDAGEMGDEGEDAA